MIASDARGNGSTNYFFVMSGRVFVVSRRFFVQIMEFLPGGDLMSLLMKEDTFSEAATKQVRISSREDKNLTKKLVHGRIEKKQPWLTTLLPGSVTCLHSEQGSRNVDRGVSAPDDAASNEGLPVRQQLAEVQRRGLIQGS